AGAAEAERQNRMFLTAMRERRPHVTLKAGMTLDGKMADLHGASRWITGEAARERAHHLRSESDAIVVGIGTVLRDDPELTVRLGRPWARAAGGSSGLFSRPAWSTAWPGLRRRC